MNSKTPILAVALVLGAFSSTAALAESSQSPKDLIDVFRGNPQTMGEGTLFTGRAATEEPLPQADNEPNDLQRGAPGSPQFEERNELQGVDPAVRY